MRPVFIQFRGVDGLTIEGCGMFLDQPEGMVKVRHPDDREEVVAIDSLPGHWLEQLRKWNLFGRSL